MHFQACRAWQRLAFSDRLWAPLFLPVLGVPPPAWWRTRLASSGPLAPQDSLHYSDSHQAWQHSTALQPHVGQINRDVGGTSSGLQDGSRQQNHRHLQHLQQQQQTPRELLPPEQAPHVVSGVRGAMALRQQQHQRAERAASLSSHPLAQLPLCLSPLTSPASVAPAAALPALPAAVLPRPALYRWELLLGCCVCLLPVLLCVLPDVAFLCLTLPCVPYNILLLLS